MFFRESETIARKYADLGLIIERLDSELAEVTSSAPLSPSDFASILRADANQVASAFGLYADHGVLQRDEVVACDACQNLMPGGDYRHAMADGDDFECSACNRRFSRRSPTANVYRMSAEALSVPRPDRPTHATNADAGEEPLGERAQLVLVAMLELGVVDSDSRRSTEEIAAKATGGDANSLKNVMSDLSTRHLIETKTGRSGGCWLTDGGQARAAKIRQQDQNSATV